MSIVLQRRTNDLGSVLNPYSYCIDPLRRCFCYAEAITAERSHSFSRFIAAGFERVSYDIQNASQFDLADDAVWGQLLYDVAAREYTACIACPDCSTFSKLHNLPGPPPLRGVSGPGRYGRKDLSPAQGEGPDT